MKLFSIVFVLVLTCSGFCHAFLALWSECFTTGVWTVCRGTSKNQVKSYFQNLTKLSTSLSWLGGDLGGHFDLSDLEVDDVQLINQLSLHNNSISSIEAGFLASFTLLDTFSIQVNPIARLPSGFFDRSRVRNVLIRNLPLETLDGDVFVNNSYLEYLTIDSTQLTEINANTFVNLPKLQHLEITSAFIQSIDRQALTRVPNLKMLSFRSNNLTTIDKDFFVNVPNLQELNLEGNQLDHLEDDFFENLPHLTNVKLNSNHLTNFDSCKSALQLLNLDLSYNIELKLTTLSQCDHLETLSIAGLQIQTLDFAALFAQTPNIQSLNLAHNQLTNLDVTTLIKTLPSLHVLNLEKNSWNCDSLKDVKGQLDQTTINVNWGPRYYDISNIDGVPCTP